MSVILLSARGDPVLEIEDAEGVPHTYSLELPTGTATFCARVERQDTGSEYRVVHDTRGWTCECPDWRYRRRKTGEDCKHIRELKPLEAMLQKLAR